MNKKFSTCWLPDIHSKNWINNIKKYKYLSNVYIPYIKNINLDTLKKEIIYFFNIININFSKNEFFSGLIFKYKKNINTVYDCEYNININDNKIIISSNFFKGFLYGFFYLLQLIQLNKIKNKIINRKPDIQLRMINHWDNIDGSIERGYSGNSIFFSKNDLFFDKERINFYARLLSSINIDNIVINNVNVSEESSYLITKKYLSKLSKLSCYFRNYGIKIFLSINFASPIILSNINTADPLDINVQQWWKNKIKEIYYFIPDFGGFLIKADSENQPGPFTYGRSHVVGANVLAKYLNDFNGLLIWRCFVYEKQDWRNKNTDRACSAYNNFNSLDGHFLDNVILQIKNGPMDFQVREPVSPLLGSIKNTSKIMELQITQEYTGQQIDLCWLIPQWKNILNFDTFSNGKGSTISKILSKKKYPIKHSGITGVSNIGDDYNWTGNELAQSNLFGYGNLLWSNDIDIESLSKNWVVLTFGDNPLLVSTISKLLIESFEAYECYTAPLGIGWMLNPDGHYGPSIDGYEYTNWGTYHRADRNGLGIDRTSITGSGYVNQYFYENKIIYDNKYKCPEELLLFFHYVYYDFILKSGKTLIQKIYDDHFKGVNMVKNFILEWNSLINVIDENIFINIQNRFYKQYINSCEWRDQINSYFFKKSGISDSYGRKIF